MTRSRSRWKAGRMGSSASGRTRPRVRSLIAACAARISCSRFSSCSLINRPPPTPPANLQPPTSNLQPPTSNLQPPTSNLQPPHHLSPEDIAEEARAVRERADAEDLGDRLPEIGERRPRADVGAGADRTAD